MLNSEMKQPPYVGTKKKSACSVRVRELGLRFRFGLGLGVRVRGKVWG